jgi:hypothetical protein
MLLNVERPKYLNAEVIVSQCANRIVAEFAQQTME